jgi:hypothetical protein
MDIKNTVEKFDVPQPILKIDALQDQFSLHRHKPFCQINSVEAPRNLDYSGIILLEYHFSDPKYYQQIKKLLPTDITESHMIGSFFKYLFDPAGKTLDYVDKISKDFQKIIRVIEEIEKLRAIGHCILVSTSDKEDSFFAVIRLSFEIQLLSILPNDFLQYNLDIANIKNTQLRQLQSQMSPILLKVTYETAQFMRKHQSFLDNLNKNSPVNDLDIQFMDELATTFSHYLDEFPFILKYAQRMHKINKCNDKFLFESISNEMNSKIDIKYDIRMQEYNQLSDKI